MAGKKLIRKKTKQKTTMRWKSRRVPRKAGIEGGSQGKKSDRSFIEHLFFASLMPGPI